MRQATRGRAARASVTAQPAQWPPCTLSVLRRALGYHLPRCHCCPGVSPPYHRQGENTRRPTQNRTHCLSRLNPQVKRALFDGGIARSNKPPGESAYPGIRSWEDIVSTPPSPPSLAGGRRQAALAWCGSASLPLLHKRGGSAPPQALRPSSTAALLSCNRGNPNRIHDSISRPTHACGGDAPSLDRSSCMLWSAWTTTSPSPTTKCHRCAG